MFEFIDDKVEQKNYEMSNVINSFMQQNFSKEKIHYLSTKEILFPKGNPNGKSLFIQSLHNSFDNHQSFLISPDSIWYIISYEIATHIKLNKEKYRELFTASTEKENMEVRADWLVYGKKDNDWGSAIDLFRIPIEEKVPKITREMLLIDFSTSTDQTRLAMLAIFMDMLQHYYTFTVRTKCGISKIKVIGTNEDWDKIIKRVKQISELFPELQKYIETLYKTLDSLTYDIWTGDPSPEFWRSIYKYQSMSGGDLITGWINNFFAYDYSSKTPVLKNLDREYNCSRLEQMPTHISKVPFTWLYLDQKINMELVNGFLGNSINDGYITPELGFGICEIV